MSADSTKNDALRQALHSSLQEVLMDVAADVPPMVGGLSAVGQQNLCDQLPLPNAAALAPPSIPPLPAYLQSSVLASAQQPAQPGLPPVPQPPNAQLLNHARAALLKQQLIADERKRQMLLEEKKKMFLQDSYLAILQSGAAAAAAKPKPPPTPQPMTLNVLLAAQQNSVAPLQHVPPQQPMMPVPPQASLLNQAAAAAAQQQKQVPNALEALGNSLRNKNDPYIDVSSLQDPDPKDTTVRRTRGGVSTPFPEKLHEMLMDVEKQGNDSVVSFFSHGRAFGVHDPDRFVSEIMPKYFKQSKWNSFARQLNLYGFIRITSGPDAGGYYHELFLKGRPNLCFHMRRVGVPQGGDRRKLKTKQEAPDPDFYSMKPLSL